MDLKETRFSTFLLTPYCLNFACFLPDFLFSIYTPPKESAGAFWFHVARPCVPASVRTHDQVDMVFHSWESRHHF